MIWKRFIDALSEEKNICAELLELAGEKQKAIMDKDIDALDAVVRREQGAALRLGHWEKQRLACMDALNVNVQAPSGTATALFFADSAPPEEARAIRTLCGELGALVSELAGRNAENKVLVESRLEYARFVMDALSAEESAGLYGAGGGSQPHESGPKKGLIDRKA